MSQFQTKLYQGAQLRQEMRINPRLYQAMELLAMPALELEEYLEQELTENPFLERTEAEESREVDVEAEGTTGDDDPHIEHDEYEGLETTEDHQGIMNRTRVTLSKTTTSMMELSLIHI